MGEKVNKETTSKGGGFISASKRGQILVLRPLQAAQSLPNT